jgi:hypothetical protein
MNQVETPQMRCRAGFARADITPPVGIYHRLWGAATHERSTGVHRPLLATAMWLEGNDAQLILALDQCLLDASDIASIQSRVAEVTPLKPGQVHVSVSHTHASGWMSRSRSAFPGGELIDPYLKHLARVCGDLARKAADTARPATAVYGVARCPLAAHRDYFDAEREQFVCGFNPDGPADDTVLAARVVADDGATLGTIVNYACHPTTLAWENTLLSPDYVGAMREVIEQQTAAPCLFLQGASGDLGPRDGFVADVAVADRNGRQLGYAALSALEALPPPGTRFVYAGPVTSGATLGIWQHRPADINPSWRWRTVTIDLPYRDDLPTIEHTEAELERWQGNEEAARMLNDVQLARDCHAHVERMTRQLARLRALPRGRTYPYRVTLGRTGAALWVLAPGELYHIFQMTLRQRFPNFAVIVATLTNDWQPGYIPTAASYGHGIYQETIAVVAPGSLEMLIERVTRELQSLTGDESGRESGRVGQGHGHVTDS